MSYTEHVLAVIDPTRERPADLDVARDAVAQGGRATVVVAASGGLRNGLDAIGRSEQFAGSLPGAAAMDRIVDGYRATVGAGTDVGVVDLDRRTVCRTVLRHAESAGVTMVTVPDHLLRTRRWSRAAERARVAVVRAPRLAS